jgi:hypothetical protein
MNKIKRKPEGKVQSVKRKIIIDCTQRGWDSKEAENLYYALRLMGNLATSFTEQIPIKKFAKKLANDMLFGRVVITIEPVEGVPIGKQFKLSS